MSWNLRSASETGSLLKPVKRDRIQKEAGDSIPGVTLLLLGIFWIKNIRTNLSELAWFCGRNW